MSAEPRPTIVIATARRGDPLDPQSVWADVALLLHSVALYAADCPVVLAWSGSCPPDPFVPAGLDICVVRQPEWCRSFGDAYNFAVEQAHTDEVLLANDDIVLCPDTVADLLDDVAMIRTEAPGIRIGLVGARTNFSAGRQNVRIANEGAFDGTRYTSEEDCIEVDFIAPILAWCTKEALAAVGGIAPINWYSDNLLCWDLGRAGFNHFVSRAYVHHVGMRSTGASSTMAELNRAGLEWIAENRHDFFTHLQGQARATAAAQ